MEDKRNRPRGTGQFVGSAVIARARYGPQTTLLQLRTFAGDYIDYTIGGVPNPAGAAELGSNHFRPISVKIERDGEQCTVIALTSDGPQRIGVTLGTALALHQAGVHAVVDGGLRVAASCSSYRRLSSAPPPLR